MSAPSPNRPQNIFIYNTNTHHIDNNPPSHDTSVEPSQIAVADRTNAASLTPTDEILASQSAMDYALECLCYVTINSQSSIASATKKWSIDSHAAPQALCIALEIMTQAS